VTESPKQGDLDRSGSVAIHSRLGVDDESFSCAGSTFRVEAAAVRAAVAGAMPYDDVDDQHRTAV
jgi:hypothetical protein